MAGSHDEFEEVFRSDCIKAIYLCRKYRSLEALNKWLVQEYGARITEYADLRTKTTQPQSLNPTTDLKVNQSLLKVYISMIHPLGIALIKRGEIFSLCLQAYKSIHEAKALLFGRCNKILGNISNHSVHVPEITDETPQVVLVFI